MREVKSTTTRWLYTRYISKHDRKPLERGILRDLSNNEANLKLRTREARFRSVSIHRGGRGEGNFVRFRFVPRGRPEFRANSDWNVRNERELSWNRSYRRVGSLYSNYGGGSRSIRPRQDIATKLFPRARTATVVSCCWRGSVTSGMLLMRPPPRVRLSVGCWFRGNYGSDTWI